MDASKQVKHYLDTLKISYDIITHPAAYTTQEADRMIEGYQGVRTKTLFLTNKKKTAFYLVIMDDHEPFNFEAFSQLVHQKKVKFANDALLEDKLGLFPGCVSPFGLLNNHERDIEIFIAANIMHEDVMTFHPNINTETLFIQTQDLMTFFESLNYPVTLIHF